MLVEMQNRFRGVLFERRGAYGTRIDATFDVPWTEAGVLSAFPDEGAVEKDRQRLWGAAEYREGATRGKAGLSAVYAAVLDADCTDAGTLDTLIAWLRARGRAFVAYTSWSHGTPSKHHPDTGLYGPFDCFRLVLPYARPVTPMEHEVIVPALFGHELPPHAPH